MAKREPTSTEYQHLLDENDTLRLKLAAVLGENRKLRKEVTSLREDSCSGATN